MQQNAFFPPLSFHFSNKDETILPRWQPEMIADREGKNLRKKKTYLQTNPILGSNPATSRNPVDPTDHSTAPVTIELGSLECLHRKEKDSPPTITRFASQIRASEGATPTQELRPKHEASRDQAKWWCEGSRAERCFLEDEAEEREREREHQTMKMEQSY